MRQCDSVLNYSSSLNSIFVEELTAVSLVPRPMRLASAKQLLEMVLHRS